MQWHGLKTRGGKMLLKTIVYGWLFVFSLIPILLILKLSLSKSTNNIPPYLPFFEIFSLQVIKVQIFLQNYYDLFHHHSLSKVLLSSFKIALISTLCTLVIGYAIGYAINGAPRHRRSILLLLVILPFFISFLMRVYAWMALLSTHGLFNKALMYVGIIRQPLELSGNLCAVCIGIIYCYLPFMVLPIYAVLDKIDKQYLEAAYDLGARPYQVFLRITLPLSLSGIITGCTLVFIPVMGEFIIPELLGSSETLTLGRTIFWEFFANNNWPMTCTMAVVTIVILVIPAMILQHIQLPKK